MPKEGEDGNTNGENGQAAAGAGMWEIESYETKEVRRDEREGEGGFPRTTGNYHLKGGTSSVCVAPRAGGSVCGSPYGCRSSSGAAWVGSCCALVSCVNSIAVSVYVVIVAPFSHIFLAHLGYPALLCF